MSKKISLYDDIIDSLDIIAWHETLKTLAKKDTSLEIDLEELTDLITVCGGCSEWHTGAILIRDSYFTTYAKDLAVDLGMSVVDAGWPANHIDWESAIEELQNDYIEVDYGGISYWLVA